VPPALGITPPGGQPPEHDRDGCEASDYSNCEQRIFSLAWMIFTLPADGVRRGLPEHKSPGQQA
jgi:hypothetical protein